MTTNSTYTNPIVPYKGGGDPWVLEFNGNYYLTMSAGPGIHVWKSSDLADFHVTPSIVYTPVAPYTAPWAPELHRINGKFYIYIAMQTTSDNSSHRMYVLEGTDPDDPTQAFNLIGKVGTSDDQWAIDGTVMQNYGGAGTNYFIWSGWPETTNTLTQNLYIAKMASPTELTGDKVLLHQPTPSWQQSTTTDGTYAINEGPEILLNAGRTFLIYSAAASFTSDYCLAMMGIDNGADPMVATNWWKDDTAPVMKSSSVAFGPGHASFPRDHDGNPYVVYHADDSASGGWADRTIRTQAFSWNTDHTPAFPVPAALGVAFQSPA